MCLGVMEEHLNRQGLISSPVVTKVAGLVSFVCLTLTPGGRQSYLVQLKSHRLWTLVSSVT